MGGDTLSIFDSTSGIGAMCVRFMQQDVRLMKRFILQQGGVRFERTFRVTYSLPSGGVAGYTALNSPPTLRVPK